VPDPVRTLEPEAAAEVLKRTLKEPTRPMTVADASVQSGLALREAEAGLHHLTSEYRGHLRVTEDGDLVHVFPTGFTKPWETREAFERIASKVLGGLAGAGRFLVRAGLLIVMLAYAAFFVALLIGLTFAGRSNDDRHQSHGISIVGGLLRMIGDALFWTFHPWSPLYVGTMSSPYGVSRARRYGRREDEGEKVRFYEKVNRFVFGPPKVTPDPHAARAKVLAEIRAKKGRVGLADVMRVTGLARDEADPLMARLMLDHDGTVEVAEGGGIVYRFAALRRTAATREDDLRGGARPPSPAWARPPSVPPLTGNSAGANVAIVLLNLFNIAASLWAISMGLTVSNLPLLFAKHAPAVLPAAGTPIVFGFLPLAFSLLLFVLPIGRAILRVRDRAKAEQEAARLAILKAVLTRAPKKEPVTDASLVTAYRVATGEEPSSAEITRQVVALGGDVDVGPEGEVRYRFADLEAEAEALEEERAQASEAEARLGRVVFASDR
jgi:hypothetical protein